MKLFKFFNWKYRYFLGKEKGVKKMILDIEFKIAKTRMIREDIRKEYDALRSRLASVEEQIKKEKELKVMPESDIARLEDQKVNLTNDSERMGNQLKDLDVEINGAKKSVEYPNGADGLIQQLDALMEILGMLGDYRNKQL